MKEDDNDILSESEDELSLDGSSSNVEAGTLV